MLLQLEIDMRNFIGYYDLNTLLINDSNLSEIT